MKTTSHQGARSPGDADLPAPKTGQSTASQRRRAREAIIRLAASQGFTATTISQITREAGLARTSFYEQYSDKEDCFLAAHHEIAERLTAEVQRAVADADPSRALGTALSALVEFAAREPARFHLATHEALIAGDLIAGARPREARERMVDQIEAAILDAQATTGDLQLLADIPLRLVLGAAIRLIGITMRRDEGGTGLALATLPEWLDFYLVPASQARWQLPAEAISPTSAIDTAQGPAPGPPLRRGPQEDSLRSVQREKILHATAEVVCAKGYEDATVAQISSSAGVSRELFYGHFKDKRDAHLQAQRFVFEQMIAASAGAFFTVSSPWPQRIWDAISATNDWILEQPVLAHFEFIGGYASGPSDAKRLDQNIMGFLVFLEDGDGHTDQRPQVPRVAREAIACAVVEITGHYVRHYRTAHIPGLLPLLSYVILTPFLGPQATNDFIDEQLRVAGA